MADCAHGQPGIMRLGSPVIEVTRKAVLALGAAVFLPVLLSACSDEKAKTTTNQVAAPAYKEPEFDLGYDPAKATPMAERVAVVGFLNKRNGETRDLEMKPGEAVRLGRVIIRVRACERTSPWEAEQLTGAFLQVDVQGADNKWRRAYSGWNYKESPSLNPVQHPIYDVWTKDCKMDIPGVGPNSLTEGGDKATEGSIPKKSAPSGAADNASGPARSDSGTDSAADNNTE